MCLSMKHIFALQLKLLLIIIDISSDAVPYFPT